MLEVGGLPGGQPARRRPTWSWSTRALSSRRPGRSPSEPCSRWRALKKPGAKLAVTGCMAERYGQELADALPEVDQVAGFGVPGEPAHQPRPRPGRIDRCSPAPRTAGSGAEDRGRPVPSFDLLNLPRPRSRAPWAYVKMAEGCDRRCGFCAIPSFRGPQRSRVGGRHPGRGRGPERPGGGPGGPGPGLLGPGRDEVARSSGAAAREPGRSGPGTAAARRQGEGGARPASLPLPFRAERRAHRRRGGERLPLFRPVAAARLPPPAAQDAPFRRRRAGSWKGSPPSAPVSPRRPCGRRS